MDFLLSFINGTNVSTSGDPSDPGYNPVYLFLDSTDPVPVPSEPVGLDLSLPAGNYCDEATVSFRGTTASYWEATLDDPSSGTLTWEASIIPDVVDGQSTRFWIRAKTVFEEVPTDDRSVSLFVEGDVRESA